MPNTNDNFLKQPQAKLIAVLADAILIVCILRAMADVDAGLEFVILVAACGVIALNATLILRAEKIERQLYGTLLTIAMIGNIGLLIIGALLLMLGMALLGEAHGGATLEVLVYFVAVGAAFALNIALIVIAGKHRK